jgi:hypothetical protein
MTLEAPHLPGLLAQLGRPRSASPPLRHRPLPQLQALLEPFLPRYLLGPSEEGPHSRQRFFSFSRTFLGFLWQVLNPAASCRLALRQIQLGAASQGFAGRFSDDTSPYCQARQRLPVERLEQIFRHTRRQAEQRQTSHDLWHGHRVKIVDGTGLSMPDTPANQEVYPQESQQKPGCGFPLLRLVAVVSLGSGAVVDFCTRSQRSHDIQLFDQLRPDLRPDDVVVGDRGFCSYAQLALLERAGVQALFRLHQGRPGNGQHSRLNPAKKLGRGDWLVQWKKTGPQPGYLTAEDYARVPESLTVRIIQVTITAPGMRTRRVVLVTTLLDPQTYPAAEIAELYLQRWRVELLFRDLKSVMQMGVLRCKSPGMVHKEILMHFIAYNLVRLLMQEASLIWSVPLHRISFKGSLDTFRQYLIAIGTNRTRRHLRQVYLQLMAAIAAGQVPDRPGRREPRAVKRRPKNHQLLTTPRHHFKECRHRGKYPNRPWT